MNNFNAANVSVCESGGTSFSLPISRRLRAVGLARRVLPAHREVIQPSLGSIRRIDLNTFTFSSRMLTASSATGGSIATSAIN